jgi:hypothetical protein
MSRKKFTNSDAEVLKQRLEKLKQQPVPSKKRELTQREWIREHESEINALLEQGFTYKQIADALSGDGVDIIPSTLRSCLNDFKRERGELPPPKKRRRPRRTKRNVPVESQANETKNKLETTKPVLIPVNSQRQPVQSDLVAERDQTTATSLESATFQARKFRGPI